MYFRISQCKFPSVETAQSSRSRSEMPKPELVGQSCPSFIVYRLVFFIEM